MDERLEKILSETAVKIKEIVTAELSTLHEFPENLYISRDVSKDKTILRPGIVLYDGRTRDNCNLSIIRRDLNGEHIWAYVILIPQGIARFGMENWDPEYQRTRFGPHWQKQSENLLDYITFGNEVLKILEEQKKKTEHSLP